ncbi:MAG: DNA-processing protein DprA [Minisyncoccia bacterium]
MLPEKIILRELNIEEIPSRLKEIPQPPEKLFLAGELPGDDYKYLCVVGSRKYTNYGAEVVKKLISGLAGQKIVIVSGLALGIDTLAHREALGAGLPTVAVPGSGLDSKVIYPATNLSLAKKILAEGGALLSEFEPNFKATTWSFPQRNRIMAGLSHAILVIEAEKKSGTLITARMATDYNRDVLTVPGSIFSSTSEGPHLLLSLGATPITSSHDILVALGLDTDETKNLTLNYDDCSPEEKLIIENLGEPVERDELCRLVNMPMSKLNEVLSLMEIKGLINERGGEIYLSK